ncbi:MAG: hypothetical protein Kow0068_12300 [Marinilabiliales bacterium]
MKEFLILQLLFFSISFCYGRELFTDDMLKYPKKHSSDIEKLFNYHEIDVFVPASMVNTVILENGYAQSIIKNKEAWDKNIANRKIKRIDIIFTKFPFKKEDWITDYDFLLAARLSELFKLDSSLNSAEIEYNLVLQTSCKTDYEARKLFHGILIKYEQIKPTQDIIVQPPLKEQLDYKIDTNFNNIFLDTTKIRIETNPIEINEKSYMNFKKHKPVKNKKPKLKELPDCPDFNRKKTFRIF